MFQTYVRRLCLKPYGNSLCEPDADFWLFCCRILVFILAFSEGVIWAYLGASIGLVSWGWFPAVFAGVFMFLIVWIVDATFITLDMSRTFYERRLRPTEEINVKREMLKLSGGIASRIIILTLSLSISAPFLAQMVMYRDVSASIAERNSTTRAQKRASIAVGFDDRIQTLSVEKDSLRLRTVNETAGNAGRGLSGRYGIGLVRKTMDLRLNDIEYELQQIARTRDSLLAQFDRLTDEDIAKRYGLAFVTDGLATRQEALGRLKSEKKVYSYVEFAVISFLVFMFLGLMLLKLFQPKTIRIYYSAQLQGLYKQYLTGAFDKGLKPEERSNSPYKMNAIRFEEWCLGTYSILLQEDERRRKVEGMQQEHSRKIQAWLVAREEIERANDPMKVRYTQILGEITESEEKHLDKRLSLDSMNRELKKLHDQLSVIDNCLDSKRLSVSIFESALRTKVSRESDDRALTEKVNRVELEVQSLLGRLEVKRREGNEIRDQLDRHLRTIETFTQAITQEQLDYARKIAQL